jgi:hypothetical protein
MTCKYCLGLGGIFWALFSSPGFSEDSAQIKHREVSHKAEVELSTCYELPEIDVEKVQVRRRGETSWQYHFRYLKKQQFLLVFVSRDGRNVYEREFTKETFLKNVFSWRTHDGPIEIFWQNINDYRDDLALQSCKTERGEK